MVLQGISNGTRCLFGGGYTNAQGVGHANWTTVIDYVTIANSSQRNIFGDLTALGYNLGGMAAGDATRGLFMTKSLTNK